MRLYENDLFDIRVEKNDYITWVYNNGATQNISNELLYGVDFDYYFKMLINLSNDLLVEVKNDEEFIQELKYFYELG